MTARPKGARGLAPLLCLLLLLAACAPAREATPAPPTPLPPTPTRAAPATPTPRPGPTPSPTLAPGTFRNPVLDQDFPDPDLLRVGEQYYAYATNAGTFNIQVARSDDLVQWELLGDALPSLPRWADPAFGSVWAPEVTTSAEGDPYVMYFTARYRMAEGGGRQCIGVATSDEPDGPFRSPAPEPLVCQIELGGSIDPSTFTDDDGSRTLLWKNDGNCCGVPTALYLQAISADGLTLQGEALPLLYRDQGWEGGLIEAPTLWKQEGRYYLFYSANDYASPRYAIGYAVADSLWGPYEKPRARPFLETSLPGGLVGPGGQDIVLDPDGDPWLLYHAWAPGGYRHLRLDPLHWQDGLPRLPPPSRDPQPAP